MAFVHLFNTFLSLQLFISLMIFPLVTSKRNFYCRITKEIRWSFPGKFEVSVVTFVRRSSVCWCELPHQLRTISEQFILVPFYRLFFVYKPLPFDGKLKDFIQGLLLERNLLHVVLDICCEKCRPTMCAFVLIETVQNTTSY